MSGQPPYPINLKAFQKRSLEALAHDYHVICIAPTGSGKSLIFERFAKKPNTRTLLFSPLIALARQHQVKLKKQAISVRLAAGNSHEKPPATGVWIVSPEKLFQSPHSLYPTLQAWQPNFLVLDECHCIWDWGEDFRPDFKKIPPLIREFNIPRSLWLTATLPNEAKEELVQRLPSPLKQVGSFELPEKIDLKVFKLNWPRRSSALLELLGNRSDPGLIFTLTRQMSERVARLAELAGKRIVVYHAGMSREERQAVESKIDERFPDLIVATSAFGMGMDYPHLKWVLLWQVPPSLLTLAQMIGRVGRGNSLGEAIVFWHEQDFRLMEWLVQDSWKRQKNLEDLYRFFGSANLRESLASYFA